MYAGHYTQVNRRITVHLPSERIPGDDFVIRPHVGLPISVFIIIGRSGCDPFSA